MHATEDACANRYSGYTGWQQCAYRKTDGANRRRVRCHHCRCSRENVKVCVAHSDLFYYPFIEARKLVREGAIGTFRGMRIFLSTPTDYITSKPDHWANKLPGGVFGESGPHIIYMTLAFINPVHKVFVNAMKLMDYPWSPFEDYRIELIGEKAASSVTMNYATKQWMARAEILGEDATLMIDLEAMSLVKYRRASAQARADWHVDLK